MQGALSPDHGGDLARTDTPDHWAQLAAADGFAPGVEASELLVGLKEGHLVGAEVAVSGGSAAFDAVRVEVLDASAAVDLLLSLGGYERIQDRLDIPGETIHAPHLIDVEVVHTLRRLLATRRIDPEETNVALRELQELRMTRYPHFPLLTRVWELRANVTAFDATYVALAEALDAPLVTSDAHLAGAAGVRARIEVYE